MSDKLSGKKPAPEHEALAVVDDAAVKEIYANKLVATTFDGGALCIAMGAARIVPGRIERETNGPREAQVHITARLALSPGAAIELAKALTGMLGSLSKAAAARAGEQGAGKTEDAAAG